MTDNDKKLRFQVLQMAQAMCDQEYLFLQEIERDATRKYPDENTIISKAEKLMKFVDDVGSVKTVPQLLTEEETSGC